jgi:hypothetical protein
MKTFEEKKIRVVQDVHCDICGKSTTNNTNVGPDYATLESCWGYGSTHDGRKFGIDICESCFYEVLNFMKQKRRLVLGPFKYPYDNDPLDGVQYL